MSILSGLNAGQVREEVRFADSPAKVYGFRSGKMKLKKRKIKYAAIFFLCWFVLLVILVDGVLRFQTLVYRLGSYALVEITLLLMVVIPTVAVYKFTKE